MNTQRPSYRLNWKVTGSPKWGWDVLLLDPEEPEKEGLLITPSEVCYLGWDSEQAARQSTAAALRELADRIEAGTP